MMRIQLVWNHGRLYICSVVVSSSHVLYLEDTLCVLHVVILKAVDSPLGDHHTSAQQKVIELLKEWCFWMITFGGLNLV
jgi:hypothetical protein